MKGRLNRPGQQRFPAYRFRVPAMIPDSPNSIQSIRCGKSSATVMPRTLAKTITSKSPTHLTRPSIAAIIPRETSQPASWHLAARAAWDQPSSARRFWTILPTTFRGRGVRGGIVRISGLAAYRLLRLHLSEIPDNRDCEARACSLLACDMKTDKASFWLNNRYMQTTITANGYRQAMDLIKAQYPGASGITLTEIR